MSVFSFARLTAIAAAVTLAGCGSTGHADPPAKPSQPSPAAPLTANHAAWSAFLAGASHYGTVASTGPQTGHIRWQRRLGAPIVAGPVVTDGGIAYVAANNGILHAIEVSTGRDRWTFNGHAPSGSDLSTGPLILPSGDLLWPGPRHQVYAITSSGRVLWTLPARAEPTTPLLDPTGHVLVIADMSGHLAGYRLTNDERLPRLLWSRKLAQGSYGSPVVAADGTIYQTAGNDLFALTPAGHVEWTVNTPQQVEVSPAIATNGIVVFGSDNEREYGIDPNGHIRWTDRIGYYTYSSPLAIPVRRVLFGNHDGQMTVLNSDTGRVIHRDQATGELWTAATVDAQGDVYFASRKGGIYGFTAGGRRLFDLPTGSQFDSYPGLAPDGTLLIGAVNGTLYAVAPPARTP
jgi:outer membrane protein assembly factor BamB